MYTAVAPLSQDSIWAFWFVMAACFTFGVVSAATDCLWNQKEDSNTSSRPIPEGMKKWGTVDTFYSLGQTDEPPTTISATSVSICKLGHTVTHFVYESDDSNVSKSASAEKAKME